jgi:hypothetical protein
MKALESEMYCKDLRSGRAMYMNVLPLISSTPVDSAVPGLVL